MAGVPGGGGPEDGPPPGALARAYDGLGHVGGFILAIMTAAVFVQVVFRYLGINAIDGLEEIPRYLFIWLVMIGSAAAMWRNEHTMLDYFVKLLGPRGQAIVRIITWSACIAVFVYLIILSWTLVPNAQYQTSAGLGLPLGYVFAAVPIGSALIIVPMILQLVAAVRALWPKSS
ncbi:TRAP-type C4-dicarboxylate transport system permease small subunit [Stella humosa]|uniref:TRAP transporter small permease protein n=1 Tax=Stella humosa TaxID=94 RepID=A0A3N1KKR3_9PROT|nr:TRAP transporter small permease [Stella humosa]ROP81411.1 TRAP-type C4-dicarboxylate transport system permease small subunit [Stella humosa]BBK32763.1 putative TRAP transporter small permease protein [Stella humosa]